MVIRAANLVVEVFLDVAEDGSAYAEALMLRNAERVLLGRGSVRMRPADPARLPYDDRRLAAAALVDLASALMRDSSGSTECGMPARDRLRAA